MLFDNINPSLDLSEFVKIYRIADFAFPVHTAVPFKAYPPRPQECLQFYPKDTETITYPEHHMVHTGKIAAITGQHTLVSNRHIGRNFMTLQVVFQPGALYRLTGVPAKELINGYLDADVVLGKKVTLVTEQLFHAGNDYKKMIEIVEQYLRGLIQKSRKISHGVDAIGQYMMQHDNKPLDWYSKEACLCHRQFDRMFKERLGINPKLFFRIIRFDQAFRMKNQYPDKDWLSIAIACGYYDYQHLVKDYKAFTGFTPAECYQIEAKAPERFFGDVET